MMLTSRRSIASVVFAMTLVFCALAYSQSAYWFKKVLINGGANLGDDWLWSGTVGAARSAALWGGKPAIAVSGIIDENLEYAAEWLIRLSSSEIVEKMKKGRYLVVNLPRVPHADIKGIKVAKPTWILADYAFSNFGSTNPEIWRLGRYPQPIPPDQDSDALYYHQNYIVIASMSVDETDREALESLRENPGAIPAWIGSEARE
jgi:5'-nucleotidase